MTEEQKQAIEEELIDGGPCEDMSEAIEYLARYCLHNKFNIDT